MWLTLSAAVIGIVTLDKAVQLNVMVPSTVAVVHVSFIT